MFARKGRKTFKTADYLEYQNEIRDHLIGTSWPFEDRQVIFLVIAGVSNRNADLDNLIKPLLDTYQSIYEEFNDNKVYGISLVKDIVPRGSEYLDVYISERKEDEDLLH